MMRIGITTFISQINACYCYHRNVKSLEEIAGDCSTAHFFHSQVFLHYSGHSS